MTELDGHARSDRGHDRAEPRREIVDVADGTPFRVWSHGYPYRTVRWHFHPEYEIHLVTSTSGRCFVGDYVGAFAPGNLVLTGPNLPHNWLSTVEPGVRVVERCIVLQFTAGFVESCAAAFPGFDLGTLLDDAQRGVEFGEEASATVSPLLRAMLVGDRLARPRLFLAILEQLLRAERRRLLASVGYRARPASHLAEPLNHVLDYIARHLGSDLRESELAELCGYTPGAFSRVFSRHTGLTFTAYVNELRVNRACGLLARTDRPITDICFEAGFNNISNFNRRFLAQTSVTPRDYRRHHRANDRASDVPH